VSGHPAQCIPLAALLLQRQRGSTRDVDETAGSEGTSDWCETGERKIYRERGGGVRNNGGAVLVEMWRLRAAEKLFFVLRFLFIVVSY
jgi:hypothetical protein